MDSVDLKALLAKYIAHVGDMEGVDFIPKNIDRKPTHYQQPFTREELEVLWDAAGWDETSQTYRVPRITDQDTRHTIIEDQYPCCWAPSKALKELERGYNNAPCILTDAPAEFNDTPLYRDPAGTIAALEREIAELRERLRINHLV